MANSTLACRPSKPRADYPLFPHRNGHWAKKVRGRFCYFGKWVDDPRGEAAIALWLDQRDDLLAGRKPRATDGELTVRDLCNEFLNSKALQMDAGDIQPKMFRDYLKTCQFVVEGCGGKRLAADLRPADFQKLRAEFSRRWGVHRLSCVVQQVRTLFKWSYESGLIERPMIFGPSFRKPSARLMRAHRQQSGQRMFEATDLRRLIDVADVQLKAMIFLGANCGFGPSDCGKLPITAINFATGWLSFPRPKTAIQRRCPLWPETIDALTEAIAKRRRPRSPEANGRVFVTWHGQSWVKTDGASNSISREFRKLLDELGLYRPGLGFYALRHGFETIAGGSRDQVAVDAIMGHADSSMAAIYRERIEDERLVAVVDHVRRWLALPVAP